MTYYVDDENGSDANLGTQEKPFKSITHACEMVVKSKRFNTPPDYRLAITKES
jgi:hypothetical protein